MKISLSGVLDGVLVLKSLEPQVIESSPAASREQGL